ncbi:electron transfer flavoprotein beta subunit [Prauserella shujinwangii]|uniref:Electron transfer flavoprotein beta subunit n=1 Tax=Prauserella shujinwangii TaxID=1453103 RepID=A0A2T0M3Z1_9PSEU|nr:electron transfer flavoprotein subunit beta/FixA family protein [Prauserella shujinwangii]PRX51471.1 electron transfer flavoprotein beta subunit [Prauserella shujinwangii]
MEVLVCVKRVPAAGARVPLTGDGRDIDTRHLGFTIGPHEECAVEEAVRLVAAHGGRVTVLAVGPAECAEQVRYALAMGADRGVLVDAGRSDPDPEATAGAITQAVRTLTGGEEPFDLLLFGDCSADAGHHQVGIRVATGLGLPIVSGVKALEVAGDGLRMRREAGDGVEVYRVPLPAAAAVREGLNLPRYPSLPGRLRARKAELRTVAVEPEPGGLRTVRLRQPADDRAAVVVLGHGAAAAPAVVDVLDELGVV